jgi:hypothetical protein
MTESKNGTDAKVTIAPSKVDPLTQTVADAILARPRSSRDATLMPSRHSAHVSGQRGKLTNTPNPSVESRQARRSQ